MQKSKLNKRAVRVFSICFILMFVLPIISVFFVGAYNSGSYYNISSSQTSGYYNVTYYPTGVYCQVYDSTLSEWVQYQVSRITRSSSSFTNPFGSTSYTYTINYAITNEFGNYLNVYSQYTQKGSNGYLAGPYFSVYNTEGTRISTTERYGHSGVLYVDYTESFANVNLSVNNSPSWTFVSVSNGYTLTFNSQGGSSINPIEDIEEGETILLGDSTGYYPEYVPTKPYYIFDGWSLEEEGSIVRQVTVTEDTTLYAQYHVNPQNCQILTSSTNNYASFYSDSSFTNTLPPIVIAGSNVELDVWIQDNAPENWYFDYLEVEYNNSTYRLYQETLDLHFTIPIEQAGYVQLTAVYSQRHTVEIRYNPSGENNDNTFDFFNDDNTFLTGETVHLWGSYGFPSFWTNTRIIGKNSSRIYESHVNVYDEWNESSENFDFDMYFTMPDEDVIVMVFWSVMAGVTAQPTVSYDESGNPYFVGIDEEDIFSQDFSRANDLIPEQLIGVAEYFTYFDGLAVIITIILVAGFAAYILRHSV